MLALQNRAGIGPRNAELGLHFTVAIAKGDIIVIGIGGADIDDPSIGGEQTAGPHNAISITDPSAREIYHRIPSDRNTRRTRQSCGCLENRGVETERAAPGHQFS